MPTIVGECCFEVCGLIEFARLLLLAELEVAEVEETPLAAVAKSVRNDCDAAARADELDDDEDEDDGGDGNRWLPLVLDDNEADE